MIGMVLAWATLVGCAGYTVRAWARALRSPAPIVFVELDGEIAPIPSTWSEQEVLATLAEIEAL